MPLIPCPECHREISDRATACPQCGFPIQAKTPQRAIPPVAAMAVALSPPVALSPLQEIAYRQKLLLYAVLINLLSLLPLWFLSQSSWSYILECIIMITNAAFSLWCYFKLGAALKWPRPLLVILTIGVLIPGFGLPLMLLIVIWATYALKRAGIRVGLMGANLATVP